MTGQEFQAFAREVTDRLARLETKLDNLIASSKTELEACQTRHEQRFVSIENEIAEIKDEKKWLWRSVVGLALLAVYDFIKSLVIGK